MIEWVLSVSILFMVNGTPADVPATPRYRVFGTIEECVEVGRHFKGPAAMRAVCRPQRTPSSMNLLVYVPMPEPVEVP